MANKVIENDPLTPEDIKRATIVTEGKPSWTFRGYHVAYDTPAIAQTSDAHPKASRIFITGEAHVKYLGREAYDFLVGLNSALIKDNMGLDPLFVETRRNTIRMARFDSKFVWKIIEPNLLFKLAQEEADRLSSSMDAKMMDYYDFYESFIHHLRQHDGAYNVPSIKRKMHPDAHFCATYLTCLLLFNKPGYMGVHVSEYFSDPDTLESLSTFDYYTLTPGEQKEAERLKKKYESVAALTNEELFFAAKLFDEEKGKILDFKTDR